VQVLNSIKNQSGANYNTFTRADEDEIIDMSKRPDFYKVVTDSLAPSMKILNAP